MVKVGLVVAALAALALAWGPWLSGHGLAAHMLQHLIVMNGAALLAAAAIRPKLRGWLAIATVAQVGLLWGWHLPVVFEAARHSQPLSILMQASLLGIAFVFWSALLGHPADKAWQAILATLVTAKAFCLFGAILCFSRRQLYPAHGSDGGWGMSTLEDQQLGGLLMVGSCAVVYVTAAVILFVRWMNDAERRSRALPSWQSVDA